MAVENSVQYLKGVGPKRAEALERLGVRTLGDLLAHYPRQWQDRRETADLSLPTATGLVVTRGKVKRANRIQAGPRLALYKAEVVTAQGPLTAVWFKHLSRQYDVFATLRKEVVPGADLWLVGRRDPMLIESREIHVDEYYLLEDPRWTLHVQRLTPIYPLTDGIGQRLLRELASQALEQAADKAPENLPLKLRASRSLLAAAQAVRGIHFPGSEAELEAARARLAYEELLLLELAWILKRRQTRELRKNFAYQVKRTLLTPFRQRLGFELTGAQKRVINEIFEDLQKPYPMTRLLQGDVGSGKTVVALASLLLAVENGYQGALMAPTEILAEQHFGTMKRLLDKMPVKLALKTGRSKGKAQDADIVVGTHALLEDDVQFPRLRLAVIDEQHRFGVRQRTTLRQKSSMLDLLVMTATPIPRTLALALYGDLDVSTLDEMPAGKAKIETFHTGEPEALEAVKAEVKSGRQAYIVYPIIEESSRLDLRSAKAEFERLREGPLKGLRVALIHGAMSGKLKAEAMEGFAAGRYDVLVATQVIEVGIDVPNATVMVIQNAERYGLASLHQLRGRIGRGKHVSRCFLVGDPKTPEARTRLQTLVDSCDGFRIGEEDLKLRGPGEFMGTAQHGELTLSVADIFKDAALLAQARADAEALLKDDPRLQAPENAPLRERLLTLYQRRWNWIDLS